MDNYPGLAEANSSLDANMSSMTPPLPHVDLATVLPDRGKEKTCEDV